MIDLPAGGLTRQKTSRHSARKPKTGSHNNLSAAAGAREALGELVRTDVRLVAEPAAAALAAAAVHPSPMELDFGSIQQGTVPPHQTIRLMGPPIARACVSHPSRDWILVDQSADELDISVDTAGIGILRGTLDLTGPAGDAVIAITVERASPTLHRDPARSRPAPPTAQRGGHPAPPILSPTRSQTKVPLNADLRTCNVTRPGVGWWYQQ